MKNLFTLLLCFSFFNIVAQTKENYQKALHILKQTQEATGKGSSSILITAKGTIHNLGHYATPEMTQDLPIEETYAFFVPQQVYHLRSSMQRSGRTFVKSKISKQDSLYSIGYYDQTFNKGISSDFSFEIAKALPSELLEFAYKNRQSLRYLGEQNDYFLLSFNYKSNQAISLFINKRSNLLEKIETLSYDNIYGDTSIITEYKDYSNKNGLKVPQQRVDYEYGKVERELTYNDIRFDVKPDTNDLKIKWLPPSFQNKLLDNVNNKERIVLEKIAPMIDLLKIESQNNKVLVAQFKDFVALFETPAGIFLNQQILDEVRKKYPEKPLRYIFATHHHPDHAGGIRTFANMPITLITTQGNEEYFKKLLSTSHSLGNGIVTQNTLMKFDFVPLQGQKTWSDEQNEVIAYEIGKSTTHTNEHLVYYFPKTKILWTGDLLFFYANDKIYPAGERGKSVYDLIINKKLDVEKIYTSWPLNGQKAFGTLEALKKAVELK